MRYHSKYWTAPIVPSPALIVPLPVGKGPLINHLKCLRTFREIAPFFASFLIVFLTTFVNTQDSSRDLTIFIVSFISSLEIIRVVIPDPNICLWIVESVADTAAVNPNGINF